MTTAARWTYVCRVDSIVPNTGVCAKVGATQVAIFRVVRPGGEESIHTISNLDPKSGASVLSRGLIGDIQGEVVVASPVYKQHYCLKTGRCIEDETLSVLVYPVRVFDGMVLVRESA